MKSKLILLVIAIVSINANSCDDATSSELSINDKLLGEWQDSNGNIKYIFANGKISEIYYNDTLNSSYTVLNVDSILVARNWEVEVGKKKQSIELFLIPIICSKYIILEWLITALQGLKMLN